MNFQIPLVLQMEMRGFYFTEDTMNKDSTQKLFDYIARLEDTNEELLKTLKYCVKLLTQIKPSAPDPQRWQEMLNTFQETIKVGERIVGEKTPG